MNQIGLFSAPARWSTTFEVGPDALVTHHRDWCQSREFDSFTGADWGQREFQAPGGSVIPMPRLEAFHGDPGLLYTYSRITHHAKPWTPNLAWLRDEVRKFTSIPFNAVFCNRYRNGDDSIGWHADDESSLGPSWPDDIAIASVSVGAPRTFHLRNKADHARKITLSLGNGDLLLMQGSVQRDWEHCVPKTKKQIGERINLTFRLVKPLVA